MQNAALQEDGASAAAESTFVPLVVICGSFGHIEVEHHDSFRFVTGVGVGARLLVATRTPQLETPKGTR